MFRYPDARRDTQVDDYHGTLVADPYRWLEDPESAETQRFVAAQNEISLAYLESLPQRHALHDRMTELWDTPRTYLPTRRGNVTVWAHNDGLSNQPVYHVQIGDEAPRVLIDPNEMSDDGTIAINATSLSPDGATFSYSVADAGSDWQVIRFLDTATGTPLDDEIRHVKFTSIAWHGDAFFYSRFPETDPHGVGTVNDPSVCFHVMGTSQADDATVFKNPDDPDPGYDPTVTHDDRYLILTEHVGTSHRNGLLYRDLADEEADWVRLIDPHVGVHEFLVHADGAVVVRTDVEAPNGRLVSIPLHDPTAMHELVPEGQSAIELAGAGGGHLITVIVDEGSHRVLRFTLEGVAVGPITLPGRGTVAELSASFATDDVFLSYQSFLDPPRALLVNGEAVEPFGDVAPAARSDIVVDRVHCTSNDSARIGMFVIRHRDTTGPAPTDLYGYGGFNINMTPVFNPARIAFVEKGGVVVVANLRGGTELGEEWHRQGMLADKQQVFDDFVACAEYLIAEGISTSDRLSISGRSNGGLLTAATMLQRPDLFAAVISHVPVTDMYRYQQFTAGRYWTVEFGDAADSEAFEWLSRYSPLHNVDSKRSYPPILITTAEGDDRVVPMHSLKFGATLQHAANGASAEPILIRIDTRAGHGMGKPTAKLIDEWADSYAFVLRHCQAG